MHDLLTSAILNAYNAKGAVSGYSLSTTLFNLFLQKTRTNTPMETNYGSIICLLDK